MKIAKVDLPEWGGCIHVLEMTGVERDEFDSWSQQKERGGSMKGFRAKLLAAHICDEKGNRLHVTSRELEQIGRLAANPIERIVSECMKISGISQSDAEKLEKNSESGQSDDSGSDSPPA